MHKFLRTMTAAAVAAAMAPAFAADATYNVDVVVVGAGAAGIAAGWAEAAALGPLFGAMQLERVNPSVARPGAVAQAVEKV